MLKELPTIKLLENLIQSNSENLLVEATKTVIEKSKDKTAWKKLFVNTGEFFIKQEQSAAEAIFEDLSEALSKTNMEKLAQKLRAESGYQLKNQLLGLLLEQMEDYEIPHETAIYYANAILYVILEQLPAIAPEKYDRYFQQEWREEQKASSEKILSKINKMAEELALYRKQEIEIYSADEMDIQLKRSTVAPRLGIEFFFIDDENFHKIFQQQRHQERLYIKARCQEEAIYSILNELWRIQEERTIFVVKSEKDWKKLLQMGATQNIYIPWFRADEIAAIPGNTNIFVITEDMPVQGPVLELRPRLRWSITRALEHCGMNPEAASRLVSETHGLYIPMKKKIFNGLYCKKPCWLKELPDSIKKTCLLLGQWTDAEGDQILIETLSNLRYEEFMDTLKPCTQGEDPFIHVIKRHQKKSYHLASVENTWDYIRIEQEEPIWKKFLQCFQEVLNEAENLFSYETEERLVAQMKGETLFWSETVRSGMIKTLQLKASYHTEENCQAELDTVVRKILENVDSVEKWKYISGFWRDFCEISPKETLKRMQAELVTSTGMMELFEAASGNLFLARHDNMNILCGAEEFLTQKEYASQVLTWLFCLADRFDSQESNLKNIFEKVFCIWHNTTALRSPEEKAAMAEKAFQYDKNAWNRIYAQLPGRHSSVVSGFPHPIYREYVEETGVTKPEMCKTASRYVEILLKHMEFKVERWIQMLENMGELPRQDQPRILMQFSYESAQMEDDELFQIKNAIRKLIYRHRYFASADWAMDEGQICLYEKMLKDIKLSIPEYDYAHLFDGETAALLLRPVPFDQEGEREKNKKNSEAWIKKQLLEFQEKKLDLKKLAEICSHDPQSNLGIYLGKYWNQGTYEEKVLRILLQVQPGGKMAADYYRSMELSQTPDFKRILDLMEMENSTEECQLRFYDAQARKTKEIPQITYAEEQIKKAFWRSYQVHFPGKEEWALKECARYGTLDIYLRLLNNANQSIQLDMEKLYSYMSDIVNMPLGENRSMLGFDVKSLLEPLQKEYMEDPQKSRKLMEIELYFGQLLDWEDMKCFQKQLKESPELFAELISLIFKKEGGQEKMQIESQKSYIHNLNNLYEKAEFCPCEHNEEVEEIALRNWIDEFQKILETNRQGKLFGKLLGRLLAFSPKGKDGYEPCEAVRNVIEDTANEEMLRSYKWKIYNMRGVYNASAGTGEQRLARKYQENADYLSTRFPKTASIYYELSRTYQAEAKEEREEAENGWG